MTYVSGVIVTCVSDIIVTLVSGIMCLSYEVSDIWYYGNPFIIYLVSQVSGIIVTQLMSGEDMAEKLHRSSVQDTLLSINHQQPVHSKYCYFFSFFLCFLLAVKLNEVNIPTLCGIKPMSVANQIGHHSSIIVGRLVVCLGWVHTDVSGQSDGTPQLYNSWATYGMFRMGSHRCQWPIRWDTTAL